MSVFSFSLLCSYDSLSFCLCLAVPQTHGLCWEPPPFHAVCPVAVRVLHKMQLPPAWSNDSHFQYARSEASGKEAPEPMITIAVEICLDVATSILWMQRGPVIPALLRVGWQPSSGLASVKSPCVNFLSPPHTLCNVGNCPGRDTRARLCYGGEAFWK